MADHSAIEWTDATWNPTTGCTKISPGCAHCYIVRTPALRIAGRKFVHGSTDIQLHHDRLDQPLRWCRPRRIFVNSLSDLFHEAIPFSFVDQVMLTVQKAEHHIFQLLTKRPARMRKYFTNRDEMFDLALGYGLRRRKKWPPRNLWLGTSIENRHFLSERAPELLKTPAAVRFFSMEPLLEDVAGDELFSTCFYSGYTEPPQDDVVRWVIVGGESGPGARPMDPRWVANIRDQCVAAGVAFFFKQWGGRTPRSGGRLLDGREWNEFPR